MSRVRDLILLVGAFAITLLVFGRAIRPEYGRADDYAFVYQKHAGLLDIPTAIFDGAGRPVAGQLVRVFMAPVDSMDELKWMRLGCTVMLALGVFLLAFLVCRMTRHAAGWAVPVVALAVGAASLALPGATSAATWAIMAGQLVALPAALAAGMWVMRRRTALWATVLGTVLLLLLSTYAYQHFVAIALLPCLLLFAVRLARRERPGLLRVLGLGLGIVGALVSNLYYVKWRDGAGASRFADVALAERFDWWLGEFLPRTVDIAVPWSWTTVWWSALFLAVLLALPLTLGLRFATLPVAVLLAWLGAALLILPGELWASARLVSAAQFVIWSGAALCAGFTVLEWTSRPSWNTFWRTVPVAVGVALAAAGCLLSWQRAWTYFAEPSSNDWRAAVCTLRAEPPLTEGVRVALSPLGRTSAPWIEYDDYGIVASGIPWALQPEVWLAELETSGEPSIPPEGIVIVPPADSGEPYDFEVLPGACRSGPP